VRWINFFAKVAKKLKIGAVELELILIF